MSFEAVERPLFPMVWFNAVSLDVANSCLREWKHRMGPISRPMASEICHALVFEDRPVAVTVASSLIRERVGSGLHHLTRENTIELSRLCAERAGLCRIALRLWREFVFPTLGYPHAISYQDADLHTGRTYRFDGWLRAAYSHSGGVDQRSGRPGRDKWIWTWPPIQPAESTYAAP